MKKVKELKKWIELYNEVHAAAEELQLAYDYVKEGKTPVSWNFSTMPSEQWKNDLGSALTTYASKQTDANWAKVVSAFVDGWATEAAASK